MKKVFSLFLLMFTMLSFSQYSGKVDYEFSFIKSEYDSKDVNKVNAKKLVNLIAEYALNHKYTLKYNKNESIYNVETSMPKDGVNNFAYKFSKDIFSKGVFYQNNETKEVINKMTTMSQDFLIKDVIFNDWKLSSETKYIGKYLCYKAISTCNSCTKDQVVTVWYAPEIPVVFGPAGYGGVPGLILEVSKFRYTLRAKNILFSKKEIKILKPQKGRVITREELKKLQREARNNIMPANRNK